VSVPQFEEKLPPGWSSTTLADLIVDGPTNGYSPVSSSDATGPLSLKLSATTSGEMRLTAETTKRIQEQIPSDSKFWLQNGDLLIQRANTIDYVGAAAIYEGPQQTYIYPDLMMRIRIPDPDTRKFIWRYINSEQARHYFRSRATGTAGSMPKINGTVLRELPVRLPPLAEQRRIVSKLESLLARSRRAKEALDAIPALLERFRQSVLAAAFRGDLTADWRAQHPDVEPASQLLERIRAEHRHCWESMQLEKMRSKGKEPQNDSWKMKYQEPALIETSTLPVLPTSWCWTSLGTLLQQIEAGHSPQALGRPATSNEAGVLKVSAVSWGEFLPEENKALLPGQVIDPSITIRAGDLLISRANTPELVGAVVIAQEAHPNLMLSDKTLRLVPLAIGVSKEYLLYALRTHWVRRIFEEDATGTSDSMRNLSQEKIRSAPVAIAPIAEQQEIMRRLAAAMPKHMGLLSQQSSMASGIGHLEQVLFAKAFRGELVPQDPNDEPATAYLERVRTLRAQLRAQPDRPRTPRSSKNFNSSPFFTPVPNRHEIPPNYLKLIVEQNGGRVSAFNLLKISGLAVDDFYAQLRTECGPQKPLRDVNEPLGSPNVYIEVSQ